MFLTIFDACSLIVDSVFDCRLPGVILGTGVWFRAGVSCQF